MHFLHRLKHSLLNLPGDHTKRKIVIIHSDDWGSIRMPSIKIQEKLCQHPLIEASDPYCRYDTLETQEDLAALFEVLFSVKDKHGNPATLSANCLLANPDFEKIKDSNFEKYYYESIEETFVRYNHTRALDLWQQGQEIGIFIPQFHGREHVNVPFWMEKLKNGHRGVRAAFEMGVFGVNFYDLGRGQRNLQRAWDLLTDDSEKEIDKILKDGLTLFRNKFKYNSKTATAPNYTWSIKLEDTLKSCGVLAMQGILFQRISKGNGVYGHRKRFTTNKNKQNVMNYQRRNVFFEPTLEKKNTDVVGEALSRIHTSFLCGKPAIIGSHRVNFLGKHCNKNRSNNLKLFSQLLKTIVEKWPEVEFLNAQQLLQ